MVNRRSALPSVTGGALVCASLLLASAHDVLAAEGERSERASVGAALHLSPAVSVGAANDDGFYDTPDATLALGGAALLRYRVTQALRLGLVPAYTHTAANAPQAVDSVTVPAELGVRVGEFDASALLLRAGYARGWHHGHEGATGEDTLTVFGGTVQGGLEYEYQLASRLAFVTALAARLDVGTFQNGEQYVRGATAFHSGVFLEAGMAWGF